MYKSWQTLAATTLLESLWRLLESLTALLMIDHATNMTFVNQWVLEEDSVIRLRNVQISNSGGEDETAAIAAFHVIDGIDHHVGYLPCHF